jgi:hypothetical protein
MVVKTQIGIAIALDLWYHRSINRKRASSIALIAIVASLRGINAAYWTANPRTGGDPGGRLAVCVSLVRCSEESGLAAKFFSVPSL